MERVRGMFVYVMKGFGVWTVANPYRAPTIVEGMVYVCSERVRVVRDTSVVHVRHTCPVQTTVWDEVSVLLESVCVTKTFTV